MYKMFPIRPKQGLKVKNPSNGMVLPWDRTTMVPANQFWLRRLESGDVSIFESVKTEKPKVEKPKAEKKKPKEEKKELKEESDEDFVL